MTFVIFSAYLLPILLTMKNGENNQFVFEGEVVEILNDQAAVKACIRYKPGMLIVDVPLKGEFKLGDKVLVSGNLFCENIENIDYLSTNFKSELL